MQQWAAGPRYWQYDALIAQAAASHGLDPHLLKAVIWRESAFHSDKIGHERRARAHAGGRGRGPRLGESGARRDLHAHRSLRRRGPIPPPAPGISPRALERWKDRDRPGVFALAEYNAGRSRVERWVTETRLAEKANADDLIGAMDFPSTRRYIEDILARRDIYAKRRRIVAAPLARLPLSSSPPPAREARQHESEAEDRRRRFGDRHWFAEEEVVHRHRVQTAAIDAAEQHIPGVMRTRKMSSPAFALAPRKESPPLLTVSRRHRLIEKLIAQEIEELHPRRPGQIHIGKHRAETHPPSPRWCRSSRAGKT